MKEMLLGWVFLALGVLTKKVGPIASMLFLMAAIYFFITGLVGSLT